MEKLKGFIDVGNLVVGVLGVAVGIIAIWLAKRQIRNFFRALRPGDSVALFGPKEAGKTTLTRYLRYRRLPRVHQETLYTESVGKIVYDLSGDDSYFFMSREMYDVGGEFKKQWRDIIKKQNPDGIIYIVDTSKPTEENAGLLEIHQIYCDLRNEMVAKDIKLRSILVLLNKTDIWGTTDEQIRAKESDYRKNVLKEGLAALQREFRDVEIQIAHCSLMDRRYTNQNNEVLRQFAMSLAVRSN